MRPAVPPLARSEVHVWTVPIAIAGAFDPDSMLAAEECARADRFRFDEDRARYIAGRCGARALIAAYANLPDPAALRFIAGQHGKPALDLAGSLHFNWSHAGDFAVFAITPAAEVGVDVEQVGRFSDLDAVARRVFSAVELAEYRALDEEARRIAFFNGWTRKEAFIKATGEGMTRRLQGFDVVLVPGEPPAIRRIDGGDDDVANWSLHAFEPAPGYVAAVAVRAPGIEPRYLDWPLTPS